MPATRLDMSLTVKEIDSSTSIDQITAVLRTWALKPWARGLGTPSALARPPVRRTTVPAPERTAALYGSLVG